MRIAAAMLLALLGTGCAARSSQTEVRSSASTSGPNHEPSYERRDGARDAGWIAIGIGAGAGAVAIGTSVLMISQSTIRSNHCDAQKLCDSDGLEANSHISHWALPNALAWGAAVVGVGTGVVLLVTHPSDRDKKKAATLGVSPSGLTLQGSF